MSASIHPPSWPGLPGLRLFRGGKVRDSYDLGDALLMVASDRISAFDVVLPTPIPGKGAVLTQLSLFWFHHLAGLTPNHLIGDGSIDARPDLAPFPDTLRDRSMLVRKADRIDVECVVRGYLAGSAWTEYRSSGTVAGELMPAGMVNAQQFEEPRFTPALKNDWGHDENVSIAALESAFGGELSGKLATTSLAIYNVAAAYARERGVIIADTKFEFGWIDGELALIDEVLTPDSSRFWDASGYTPGRDQPSFDKQFVRDWLAASGWDKEPPGPELPREVVEGTASRYREAYERLTGRGWGSTNRSDGEGYV